MDAKYNEFHAGAKIQNIPISRNNFTYRLLIEYLEKIINPIKDANLEILDYGCGVGTLDFYLASNNMGVLTGVDISPNSISLCKKSAERMSFSRAPVFYTDSHFWEINSVKSKKFDLIICSEVIEHVDKDQELLVRLSSVLNRNGYIFLTTPSSNAPLFKIRLVRSFDSKVGHLRRYTQQRLIKMFKDAHFDIKEVQGEEGILRNSLFIFPTLNQIVRFLKGPISDIVTFVDKQLIKLFGESNLFVLAQKR